MRKGLLAIIGAGILGATMMGTGNTSGQLLAADKPTKAPAKAMKLKVGDMAPDFTLLAFDGKGLNKVSLQDYRGKKNVALAFYVFAFTGG
jgi:hypothetical protein